MPKAGEPKAGDEREDSKDKNRKSPSEISYDKDSKKSSRDFSYDNNEFGADIISREYKMFREAEVKKPRTIYEKACDFSEHILHWQMDPKSGEKIKELADFAHLNINPNGVASLTILFTLLTCIPAFILMITKPLLGFGLDMGNAIFVFIVVIPIAIYLYMYPSHLKKKYEMDAGSEIVSAVLYMVCHMRNTPSLEGAVNFASKNLTGPLLQDLRKIMWDVRVGNYLSINDALLVYAEKWKNNREFVESIELLIASLRLTGGRRTAMLDEAVRVILEGNRESARHYVQGLKMPMMIINAMGIILPIMGLVMFPIIAIFLKVEPTMLLMVYDIILPLILFFVIMRTLEKRPATYSRIDISEHPDVPPEGKFFLGKRAVSPLPIAIIVSVAVVGFGLFLYFIELSLAASASANATAAVAGAAIKKASQAQGVIPAVIFMFGIAIGPAIYYLLLSRRRVKVREAVQKIETEFKEALFQLGNTLASGIPIERAMDEAIKKMEGLAIKDMFIKASSNIKNFGMTFSDAFFDKQYGSVLFYPSTLVKSVMRATVESSKKGIQVAALSMISISRYLRGLHRTQEEVKEALNDVVSSLRFQAYLLSPLIAGVISTMAIIMIQILQSLSIQGAGMGAGMAGSFLAFSPDNMAITPFQFILVVGIYLVESLFLLCYLMSGIESGEDPIGRNELTGVVLIMGTIVFIGTVFLTLMIFQPMTMAVA